MDEQHRTAVEHEAPGPQPPELALTTLEDAEGNPIVLRYSERQLLDVARNADDGLGTVAPRVVEVIERLGRMRRGMLDDEAERVAKLDELISVAPGVARIGRAVRNLAPLAGAAAALRTDPPTEEELAERRDPATLRDRVLDHLADAVDDAISPAEDDPHAAVRASTRVRQYAGAAASLGELVPPPAEATPAPALEAVLAEVWNELQAIAFSGGGRAEYSDGAGVYQPSAADADALIGRLRARLS